VLGGLDKILGKPTKTLSFYVIIGFDLEAEFDFGDPMGTSFE
jgi:hypothetical protein